MSIENPRVLNVGQCGFDHRNISHMLADHFGAEVTPAATADEAVSAVRRGEYDLVLINRVFDVDGTSGLDLIQRLQEDEQTRATPAMLVSNFAAAQEAAVALGARHGFGKDALTTPNTRERLTAVLRGEA